MRAPLDHIFAATLALSASCISSDGARGDPGPPGVQGASTGATLARDSARASEASAATVAKPLPVVARPDVVRGLYVNRWAAIGDRMWELIDVAKRTEVNALVIDVKDDRGFLLYRSNVPLARAIGADTNRPMSPKKLRAVLDTMRANAIFPIARIVVAKDPLLADTKREWAVKRRSDGTAWLDKNGKPWLDPHHREVWTYAADLADEAIALGFSEVQFDYVRFPDEPRLIREAVFPLAQGRVRAKVIHEQLGFLHGRLSARHVPMAIDVFGLTTSVTTDMGIGQKWEQFIDQADVVAPMTYPSHYAPGTYHVGTPNAHPYTMLDHAMRDAHRRSAGIANAATIVPWYQDFTLGPPRYGADQVRAQMQAGYDNGVRSWLLWNPGSRYTISALRPAILEESAERKRAPSAPPDTARPQAATDTTTRPR
ncbi:MAG: putative glycosyl hydrolase domain [Gemmatimonadetes bacterium]|nr:putative glycosyl hydrolase domain [Gemmatimonadota bacterium]